MYEKCFYATFFLCWGNRCERCAGYASMAYESYQTAENILDTYASSISEDAKTILENRVFGYKSGDSRLFELLEAQRAYDEVLISFMEAQREK